MNKTPKRRGRPRKSAESDKKEYLDVRLNAAEKQTFKDAADLAGIGLSTWARERLRRAAIQELESARRPIPLLKTLTLDQT